MHVGEDSARKVCEYMNEGTRTHDKSCDTLNDNFQSTHIIFPECIRVIMIMDELAGSFNK